MLLVDKPKGMTSHDVVEVVRRQLGMRRIGHTGTLDPAARGLLIVLVGSATRAQQAFQGHDKTYRAVLQLGTQTETGDVEGRPIRTALVPSITRAAIEDVFRTLHGPLTQTPPAYSAVKVRGRPAYWWARRQQPVTLTARVVQILELALLDHTLETITFRVRCSAGTYVRTLGETIADRLGTVGHLSELTRHRIGSWDLTNALALAWIQSATAGDVVQALRPVPPQDLTVSMS